MYKHHHHSLRTCSSVSLIRCWQCIMKKYLMYSLALRSKDSFIRTTTFWKNLEANYESCLLIVMDKVYGIIYTFICTLMYSTPCDLTLSPF